MEFHRVILYSEKSENQTESLFFVHDKKKKHPHKYHGLCFSTGMAAKKGPFWAKIGIYQAQQISLYTP